MLIINGLLLVLMSVALSIWGAIAIRQRNRDNDKMGLATGPVGLLLIAVWAVLAITFFRDWRLLVRPIVGTAVMTFFMFQLFNRRSEEE